MSCYRRAATAVEEHQQIHVAVDAAGVTEEQTEKDLGGSAAKEHDGEDVGGDGQIADGGGADGEGAGRAEGGDEFPAGSKEIGYRMMSADAVPDGVLDLDNGSNATPVPGSFMEKAQHWPWRPRLAARAAEASEPTGERPRGGRALAWLLGQRLPTEQEAKQLPSDYFMNLPHSLPAAVDLVKVGFVNTLTAALALACWGWSVSAASGAGGAALYILGMLFMFGVSWPWACDALLAYTMRGHEVRILGSFSLTVYVTFALGCLIPVGGGSFAGLVGPLGVYVAFAPVPLLLYIVQVPSMLKNWRWLLPIMQLGLCIGAVPVYFGFLLAFTFVIVPRIGAETAIMFLPSALTVIEQLFVKCLHNKVYVLLQWPAVEKAVAVLTDSTVDEATKKHAWIGGDVVFSYDVAVFYQVALSEAFRLALLFRQAISDPNNYTPLFLSMALSSAQTIAIRLGWPSYFISKAAEPIGCPLIARCFAPDGLTRFIRECKKLCGYPRYFGILALFLGRLLLTQDLASAVFAAEGFAPLTVLVTSVLLEVVEDIICHYALAYWDPVPVSCEKRNAALHALHPRKLNSAQLKVERMRKDGVHFIMGTMLVWTNLALSLVVGLDYLLNCTNDATDLDIVPMMIIWQENSC